MAPVDRKVRSGKLVECQVDVRKTALVPQSQVYFSVLAAEMLRQPTAEAACGLWFESNSIYIYVYIITSYTYIYIHEHRL